MFASLGVRKLRLTGGEPLLRRGLERLIAMLAGIGGIQDIALTTNGALLARKARGAAGLRRVTVSLDSLDDAAFMALNDAAFRWRGCWKPSPRPPTPVWRRSRSTWWSGAARTGSRSWRWPGTSGTAGTCCAFIEYMDVGTTNSWRLEEVVPAAEIISLMAANRSSASWAFSKRVTPIPSRSAPPPGNVSRSPARARSPRKAQVSVTTRRSG